MDDHGRDGIDPRLSEIRSVSRRIFRSAFGLQAEATFPYNPARSEALSFSQIEVFITQIDGKIDIGFVI